MKCQNCGKYEATTHITQIINGQKSEIRLCPHCASQSGAIPAFTSVFDSDFENFFGGLWQSPYTSRSVASSGSAVCKTCGTTLSEVQSRGKLGCSDCYTVFRDFLLRPLKEIHGNCTHTGKIPKRAGRGIQKENTIDKLKEDLSRAVLEQNFEKAAELRDKINELENKD